MKKVVSLFMAVIMIFSIAVPSFAASAAETAQLAYASDADAVSSSDDIFSDAIGGVVDFFKKAIDTIVDFFKWLFGIDSNVPSYKITFYDGEKVINTMTVKQGDEVPSPTIPRKTGYTFIGWSPAIPEIMPAYDLEVKALWSINKYTITFDSNGGSDIEPIIQNYGTAITPPEEPVWSGYKFMGWQEYKEISTNKYAWVTVELPEYMPAKDITYKADWLPTTYSISFYLNAGDTTPYHVISDKSYNEKIIKTAEDSAEYGKAIEMPADPELEGHTFIGWDKPIPDKMPAKNEVRYAVWAENDYTVSFIADGKILPGFPLTAKYGTVFDIPEAPAKTGYAFVAWKDGDGNSASSIIKKNANYVAEYSANTYKINWIINGEKSTVEIKYGSKIQQPTVSAKPGYTFIGWDKTVPETMNETRDLTFTAVFEAKEYTISFDTDGGSYIAPITQGYETEIKAPANPTKTGYTFKGWDKEIPKTMPLDGLKLKAKWDINQYTINFKDTGDTEYPSITEDYGTKIDAAIANPTKEGYTFTGWDRTIPSTMPAENLTITAQWKINQYTISFDTLNGSAVNSITADYGSKITAPAAPTKSDYEFIGWAKVASPSVEDKVDLPATMPAENITFYAIWRGAEKTVIFNSNKGTFDTTTAENTTSTKHTKVIRNGENLAAYVGGDYAIDGVTFPKLTKTSGGIEYAILYWSTDSSFRSDMSNKIPDILELSSTTESVEYWAQWAVAHSFKLYDGSKEIRSEVLPVGMAVAEFMNIDEYTAESRKGYTFDYWAVKDADGKLVKAETIYETMPEQDVEYYAVWTANEYAMTFNAGEGTFNEEIGNTYTFTNKYKASVKSLLPQAETVENAKVYNPTREGFDFMGWTTEEGLGYEDVELLIEENKLDEVTANLPTTMPLDGAVYYALWVRAENYARYYADSASTDIYTFEVTEIDEETEEETTVTKTAEYKTKFGTAIEIPEVDPVKKGYEFIGWYDTKDAEGGNRAEDIAMPAKDIKLYARFAKTYSFSFANCGNVETIVAKPGDDVTAAIKALEPKMKGHEFSGWKAPDGKVYISNAALALAYPTMTEENLTFVAEWEINTYTIKFDSDGGTPVESIILPFGAEVPAPAAPTKTGYTFVAWVDANGNNVSIPDTMPEGGFECKAKWKINQYSITFDAADGKFANGQSKVVITVDFGAKIEEELLPDAPEKYGYRFTEWTPSVPATMPAKDMTVTAEYGLGQFTASFYISEDELYEYEVYNYGDEIEEPTAPSKMGYTFEGWSLTYSENKEDAVELGKINGDAVFYAIWVPKKVSINFIRITDDGEIVEITTTTDNWCDGATTYPDSELYPEIKATKKELDEYGVERTYTLYWTVSGKNLVVKHGEQGTPCVSESTLTYVENWVVDTFTIEFNTNCKASVASKSYDSGDRIKAPNVPINPGYEFVKWVVDDGVADTQTGDEFIWTDESGINGKRIYESVKLEAVWTEDTFSIVWDVDGTRTVVPDVLYNSTIAQPEDPTKDGYTFTGWTPSVPATMPAENLTFVATWEANKYDAIFDANGGAWADGESSKTVEDVPFGETIKAPANPSKEGYTFGGWTPAVGEMDDINGKTFTAVWNAAGDTKYVVVTHKMKLDATYETTTLELTGATDSKAEAIYTVDKGFVLNTEKSVTSGVITADGSLVLHVYLDRIACTVTIDGTSTTYLYGQTVAEPALPTIGEGENKFTVEKECFEGWYVIETNTEAVFPMTVTKDINIESRLKSYTILFATEGGETVAPLKNVEVYTDIYSAVKDIDAKREGYSFVGWTDNKDTEEVKIIGEGYSFKMPNKDLTLYAVWEANETENQ